jgi:endoglucanase
VVMFRGRVSGSALAVGNLEGAAMEFVRANTVRRFARVLALALSLGVPVQQAAAQAPQNFNYAEALQKAIYFYEIQSSGRKPAFSRVVWRGDAQLTDGADNGVDLSGGWLDAGDHIKFGLPMASAVTMLAWGAVENRAAYAQTGQLQPLLNNLRHANDYLIKAHPSRNVLYAQVGEEGPDHSFWGPVETQRTPRRSFKIDSACPGSDLASEVAAAMAASSIVFRPTDPTYADTLLRHARELFDFAEATRGTFYVDCVPQAQCCYNSRFGDPNDELTWAAVWLHKATGEAPLLQKARATYPTMCKEQGSNTPCFRFAQGWNDKHFGVYVLMAQLTGEQQFRTDAQRWLDFHSVGGGPKTTGGLMFVDGFGAIRYATNTAFISFVYADFLGLQNPLFARYHDFAKRQIDYALGNNPLNRSFVSGFGNNPPINPHHRTGHGSWVNGGPTGVPTNNRHTLFGALVGGPTSTADTSYRDDRSDFRANEVALDFNAGFTSALARLAREFPGQPLANFPPPEPPDMDELFIEAGVNVSGPNFTEVRAFVVNRSSFPARELNQGTFRYYFTLEPGVSPSQITVTTNFSQCQGASGPTQFSGSIFFVTIDCSRTLIFPGGQSEHRKEVQFRIASSGAWDPTNDYSFQGIRGVMGGQAPVKTDRIVLFEAGRRVFGIEPAIHGNPNPMQPPPVPPPLNLDALAQLAALLQNLANLFRALLAGS